MPLNAALSENRHGENVKSSPLPAEKTEASESDLRETPSRQVHNKPSGQNKSFSASLNSSVNKKRLQSHAGLSHHPYQSSHPGNARLDLHIASKDNLSSFTQRVMSAKLLRLKQLQNQLSEAHLQLNELLTENRLLRSLQKRQDLALDRYEGTQAQLPQLVRSHQEEVRVLRAKYKNLKHQYRNVTCTLKEREAELQNLKEQHAHLLKLSKDRNLGEREALTKQVNDLKMTVDNQTNTIQMLNRKVLLETKNLKFQLQQEMQRHKTTQSELQQTFIKVDQLQAQLDQARERNILPPSMDRFSKTSSSLKLTGGHKPLKGMLTERASAQNSRNKKASNESAMQVLSNNTDPSSVLLDSSPATFSEKTNEFSTSLESSPEHSRNEIDTSDSSLPSTLKSNSYQLHRSIKQKVGTELSVNFDPSKGKNAIQSCHLIRSVTNDTLEREYENAVAMLSELSTKHNESLVEDVSCSLASLDLTAAKHVAALANATFALKGELPSKPSLKEDYLPSSHKTLLHQAEDSTPTKSELSSNSEGKGSGKFVDPRQISQVQIEHIAHRPIGDVVGNNMQNLKHSSDDKAFTSESFIQGQIEDFQKVRNKKDEELQVEASCKEALLKALKAIDDSSNKGNDSDDSDSAIIKMSTGTVIPQRMFSTLNSSGIGVADVLGPSKRRKPFK